MVSSTSDPFPARHRDEFDEWLRTPAPEDSSDPRITVRRAHPSEFDRIYDLIDEAFGFKRSRALSDWIYRHNPYGIARCWLSVERATGSPVGVAVNWPWPLARGMRALAAAQGGDAAVAQAWQGQRIHEDAGNIRDSHPWIRSVVHFGWPNPPSVKRLRRLGRSTRLIGTLARQVLPLRTKAQFADLGLPDAISAVSAKVVDGVFGTWYRRALAAPFHGVVHPVRRFDGAADEVTRRCIPIEGYWCPHDFEFLNWLYFRHPDRQHVALGVEVEERFTGYGVIRIGRGRARLMEFVVPADQEQVARVLLLRLIEAAVDAGATYLAVTSSPSWRHRRLCRSAGFLPVPSNTPMYAYSRRADASDVRNLKNWQLLGGDLDPFSG